MFLRIGRVDDYDECKRLIREEDPFSFMWNYNNIANLFE